MLSDHAAHGHTYHIRCRDPQRIHGLFLILGHVPGGMAVRQVSSAAEGIHRVLVYKHPVQQRHGERQTSDGLQVQIGNVVNAQETYTVELPYETVYCNDPSLPQGKEQVIVAGSAGQMLCSAEVVYVNAQEYSRIVTSETVLERPVDQIVAVVDPMPSKLLEGYEMIHRLKLWKKPVVWTVNRWTEEISGKDLRKILGPDRHAVMLPEVPRGIFYQGEYAGVGFMEQQKIRRLMAPGMEEIIKRLKL